MLHGAMTALVTPFRDGQVDYDRLKANVEFQIDQGIDALVPVGTTGESPTLTHSEHREVIDTVVQTAAGRVKVIAGTGSNSTSEALELTEYAKRIGADAALMVNPYYNKPTQEGLYRHFMHIAEAVDLPIVLYNIPGRTAVTLEPATIARLAEHDNIIAVKEATGSMDMASGIADLCDITIISGDDSLTLPLMSLGGKGVISVLSNIMPAKVKALVTAGLNDDFPQALQLHRELFSLCKGCLTLATNPIPIKAAMAMLGTDTGDVRLPLWELDGAGKARLRDLLKQAGLPVQASSN